MTAKQNPVQLDAYMLILHAMQVDQTFEDYLDRVVKMAHMKLRKVQES